MILHEYLTSETQAKRNRSKALVILIGGETHTGKTLMAQKLLEQYHFPYTSLDHIKMGLIRGYQDCGFTACGSDEAISEKLWGVVRGIIDTCLENKQDIILEGCYLPPAEVNKLLCKEVACIYLVFSQEYIGRHFDEIIAHENVMEKRLFPAEIDKQAFLAANSRLKESCESLGLTCVEINSDYEKDMRAAYEIIHQSVQKAHIKAAFAVGQK